MVKVMAGNGRFVKGDPRINREGRKIHKNPKQVQKQVDVLAKYLKGAGKRALLKELKTLKGKDFVNAFVQLMPFYQAKLNSMDATMQGINANISIPPSFWTSHSQEEQRGKFLELNQLGIKLPDMSRTWEDGPPKSERISKPTKRKPKKPSKKVSALKPEGHNDKEIIDIQYEENDLHDEGFIGKR